ncbi:hypothetical protein GX441_02305 [bacterium]|nr:hypothetical protein [bacterium]
MIRDLSLSAITITFILIAAVNASGVDIDGGFEFDEVYRNYVLHIPPQYNEDDSLPLLINIHGGNGTPQQQETMTGMNTKADSEGFFVLYPNGTMLPVGYFGWNAGEWTHSGVDDVGFISALLDTLKSNYKVDTLRIYATGFSIGAMMCHRLACELSERIAAVAPVEGGLTLDDWNSCEPKRLIPVMHFHHRYDANVPYYGDPTKKYAPAIDSVMRHWAQTNGCNIGPDTFYNAEGALRQRWTRADDSCEVVFWTLEQGNGHTWPGSPTGTQELSANDEMWEFFKAHPIPVEEPEPGITEQVNPHVYLDSPAGLISQDVITVNFSLDCPGRVVIKLYDVSGRALPTLLDGTLDAGEHEVSYPSWGLPTGVYLLRMETPNSTATQTVKILR